MNVINISVIHSINNGVYIMNLSVINIIYSIDISLNIIITIAY